MIGDFKVSFFKGTKSTEVSSTQEIDVILESIKKGVYKNQIAQLRSGDEEAKKQLPMVAVHGVFENFRKKDQFIEASGLIILDIDDVEDDLEEVKQDIMESNDSVYAAMISPSGDGIKVLYYVNPYLINSESYRQIGKQLVSEFDIYGSVDFLSVTDCLIMTYDPKILINEEAVPAIIHVKEVSGNKQELEPLDKDRKLWEDVEDFFDTVLYDDIKSKTNNNYHFIQVAILDLAKFGFKHPEHDLSFVVDYSEATFKYSAENKRRFKSVCQLAENYYQTKWPYKFVSDDFDPRDDEEDEINYDQYKTEDIEKSSSEEEEVDPFIDYSNFKQKVKGVILEGNRVGREISLKNFADIFRFRGTGILTVTGIPTHGKTEYVDACTIDLARLYDEETIVAGFEQTAEEHVVKLMRKMVGKDITCPSYYKDESNDEEFDSAYQFIIDHIFHLDMSKVGGNVVKILEAAAKKIKERRDVGGNPKYVVIDPFNMLSIKGRMSRQEKIEEILRLITTFSHQMNVMVILVAHPFKMKIDEKTGEYLIPDFYSVKGSSAFFEMSYHGLVIYRRANGTVLVKVLKVKQNNLGHRDAEANFGYDRESGRYEPLDESGNELDGDHRDYDWLDKAIKK